MAITFAFIAYMIVGLLVIFRIFGFSSFTYAIRGFDLKDKNDLMVYLLGFPQPSHLYLFGHSTSPSGYSLNSVDPKSCR